jgi:hypothetical protein
MPCGNRSNDSRPTTPRRWAHAPIGKRVAAGTAWHLSASCPLTAELAWPPEAARAIFETSPTGDPMRRGRRIYEIERSHGQLHRHERGVDNLNARVCLQPVVGERAPSRAKLNASDAIAQVGQPQDCLSYPRRDRKPAQRGSAHQAHWVRAAGYRGWISQRPARLLERRLQVHRALRCQGHHRSSTIASSPTHRCEDLAVAASLRRPTSSAETRPRGTRPLSTSNSRIAFTVSSPRRPSV